MESMKFKSTLDLGATASLTATQAEYCEYDQWTDGNTQTNCNLTVTSPTNLVASFVKQMDADGVAEDWKAENTITNV